MSPRLRDEGTYWPLTEYNRLKRNFIPCTYGSKPGWNIWANRNSGSRGPVYAGDTTATSAAPYWCRKEESEPKLIELGTPIFMWLLSTSAINMPLPLSMTSKLARESEITILRSWASYNRKVRQLSRTVRVLASAHGSALVRDPRTTANYKQNSYIRPFHTFLLQLPK